MSLVFRKKVSQRFGLWLSLAFLALALQGQTLLWAAAPFVDVPASHWADRYIDYLSGRQIVSGYPDQTFRPNQPVTRAEFAAMLAKSQNMLTGTAAVSPFADVPASHWAAGAIQSVANRGWIAGYPGNRFMPNQPISQAEMYTIVAKATGQPLVSDAQATEILGHFQDAAQVPAWARASVATAAEKGLYVSELSNIYLSPNTDASRASVATTLAKLVNASFRTPVEVAQQSPTGTPVNATGTLQATANAGEWVVVTDSGNRYILDNPGTLTQQPWFRVGNTVQLKGTLDTQASTSQRQVVAIETLSSVQPVENSVSFTGTLRPSVQTPGAWVVVTSDNQVYRILNPENYTNLPWFRYGAPVTLMGNLRPDVTLPQGEGTAVVASRIDSSVATPELALSGTLQPTVEAGGWTLTEAGTNRKYVLLGIDQARTATWFTSGAKVEVKGEIRPDIPTVYMEGPVLMVSSILPNPGDVLGSQEVNLYFPNLISMVRNPGDLIDQPVTRVLEGPDLPRKAVLALLQGPTAMEQIRGYFQDQGIRDLSLNKLEISQGIATVLLKAPAGFQFQNSGVPARVGEEIDRTLSQFAGIQQVKTGIISADNSVIWSSN